MGCPRTKIAPRKTKDLCAKLSRTAGHQIVSIIATCKRTTEEACTQGPLCTRTAEELFRTKPPYGRANFGGSPRTKGPREIADLTDTGRWRRRRRRGLPFRLYLHARISRITVVEQLPQIITYFMFKFQRLGYFGRNCLMCFQ